MPPLNAIVSETGKPKFTPMPLPLRIAHGVMSLLFFLSVLVQFNDPSPLPWILMYGAAAVATGLAAARRPVARKAALLVGAVALLWEVHYLSIGAWHTPFSALTEEWHMTSTAIVDGREFYALLWIAACMGLIWFKPPRAGKSQKA